MAETMASYTAKTRPAAGNSRRCARATAEMGVAGAAAADVATAEATTKSSTAVRACPCQLCKPNQGDAYQTK
jgi:hypothetical protein